tara:strand:- start:6960 stop:7934 length:975 start_codon:yes stop_codon:yes gene_type:complete
MNFINSWILFFLPLIFIPFIFFQINNNKYSWNEMLPEDFISSFVSFLLKILSSLIIGLLIVLLAGPYSDQKVVERIGEGAQIGLVLDRSASMDDPFAGGGDKAGETKSGAASRLIIDFFESRSNDMVGVVTFSNSAMFVLPLTQNKDAIKAAVNATSGNALFQTNIGAGLTSSAALFKEVADSGSRAIILLSDGAGRIDANTQQKIKDWFDRFQIGLYWIVLREPGGLSIFDEDFVPNQAHQVPPQLELYDFFKTFRSPFKAYEAEDPKSLETAINDINLKEKKPIIYTERIPGQDYSVPLIILTLILSGLLLLLKLLEVRTSK